MTKALSIVKFMLRKTDLQIKKGEAYSQLITMHMSPAADLCS